MNIPSAVGTAIISAAVSLVTTFGTIAVGERNLARQYKLENASEAAVEELLNQQPFRMRSFAVLKYHLAGFDDDKLRQVLVRAGAVRWLTNDGEEVWGLLSRNHCWLSETKLPVDLDSQRLLQECPSQPK